MAHKSNLKIPRETFHLLSALYPRLATILSKHGVSVNDFFLLSYVKNLGKERANGEICVLRTAISGHLEHVLSDGGMTGRIESLESKDLVDRGRLKPGEKEDLFKTSAGRKEIVIITTKGLKLLDDFNDSVDGLFQDITEGVGDTYLKVFLKTVKKVCQMGLERLAPKDSQGNTSF